VNGSNALRSLSNLYKLISCLARMRHRKRTSRRAVKMRSVFGRRMPRGLFLPLGGARASAGSRWSGRSRPHETRSSQAACAWGKRRMAPPAAEPAEARHALLMPGLRDHPPVVPLEGKGKMIFPALLRKGPEKGDAAEPRRSGGALFGLTPAARRADPC